MKVTDVKAFVVDCFRTNWVFVKVYTDEGIDGWGELLVSIIIFCAVYIPLFWIFSMNKYERNLLIAPIKKILRRA